MGKGHPSLKKAEVCSSCAGWGTQQRLLSVGPVDPGGPVHHLGSTPHLLRKDAAGYLWPLHWALFRPELPRRSAAYSKRFALAGRLPWLLRLSLGSAASGCGHLRMGKGALSPKAFS